jgi:hypothetical protein
MAVMPYHTNVLATDSIVSTAEGLYDCSVANSTSDFQATLTQNNVDAIRVAGIHDRDL